MKENKIILFKSIYTSQYLSTPFLTAPHLPKPFLTFIHLPTPFLTSLHLFISLFSASSSPLLIHLPVSLTSLSTSPLPHFLSTPHPHPPLSLTLSSTSSLLLFVSTPHPPPSLPHLPSTHSLQIFSSSVTVSIQLSSFSPSLTLT